jgi:hypothetical protein
MSAMAIAAETQELRMCIQEYLCLATVPNMHKLADYRDQIAAIEHDASRMAMQNWFFSHPDVQQVGLINI